MSIAGVVLYFMTLTSAPAGAAAHLRFGPCTVVVPSSPPAIPSNDFLRARTQVAIVTPVLLTANVVAFVAMRWRRGRSTSRRSRVGGELCAANHQRRVASMDTSMFVHAGVLHPCSPIADLRLSAAASNARGRIAFAAAFLARESSPPSSAVRRRLRRRDIRASGALFGVMDHVATVVCGYLAVAPHSGQLHVVKRIAAGGAICVG